MSTYEIYVTVCGSNRAEAKTAWAFPVFTIFGVACHIVSGLDEHTERRSGGRHEREPRDHETNRVDLRNRIYLVLGAVRSPPAKLVGPLPVSGKASRPSRYSFVEPDHFRAYHIILTLHLLMRMDLGALAFGPGLDLLLSVHK